MPEAPRWSELRESTRAALERPGYDQDWYAEHPSLRATILLVSYRLRATGLWRFVGREDGSTQGCLHFRATDVDALREALAREARFTTPGHGARWQSRERRFTATVHLKHFRGWPLDRIQAHLDLAGLPQRWWWWLVPPAPAALWLRHALHYSSYRDTRGLCRALERRGGDPMS